MKTILRTLAVLIFAAPAVHALGSNLNFDQGVNVSAVVKEVKGKVKAASYRDGFRDARPLFNREERDCATVRFRPGDPTVSERIRLESRIYREICYDYPDPPRRPRRPRRPRVRKHSVKGEKGEFQAARRECHERWERTERRQVRVEVLGRGEMLPWETDTFSVCLQGQWLSARSVDSSHEYSIDTPGWSGDMVTARAIRKRRSQPDPFGIAQTTFAFDPAAGNFKLELGDRWSEFYTGETVTFTMLLKRYHKNWFDGTVLNKEITLPAAEAYTINFADFASELTGDLKPGKKYYVKWRFRRIGSVSKDDWQKYRESGKAHYEGKEFKSLLSVRAN